MSYIGFVGSGNMAEAMIKGLLSSKKVKRSEIIVSDINSERLGYISSQYGIKVTSDNKEVVQRSDLVVLSVKPGAFDSVLNDIRNLALSKKIFISIAAGLKTSSIKRKIGKNIKLVRVMPNTPSLVQEGASTLYFSEGFSDDEKENVITILGSIGKTYQVETEDLMDAVTGLSGSGPAFVFIFIEALSDAGVKMGLSRKLALELSAQTVLGTSKLLIKTSKHPGELKDMVSSPGGTTISGIHKLEEKGFRDAVISAVESATIRSKELSQKE